MNIFGRKSAGRALARPGLARAFAGQSYAWNMAEAAPSYEQQVRAAYASNPVAQRAVRLVAEGLGGAPLATSDEAALTLVQTTSAGQSLLETVAGQLLLHGNGYIQILTSPDGTPCELYALRPERVRVEGDARGWPIAFVYKVGDAAIRLPAQSVIHIKAMNPLDDHYGLGCLGAAAGAVAIHNLATKWNKALLDNAARPSGALVYDPGDPGSVLSPDQFERLRAEMDAGFAGAANAGRPMLLEGGLKWQALSFSPTDMDFIALKAAAARDIALAFGVPPVLLGLPGDATYANYREANRALWRQTILPLAGKILGAIGQGLVVRFPGLTLGVNLDQVSELSEDRERLWAQVSAADFLSLYEKRALVGYEAVGVDAANDSAPPPDAPDATQVKYNQNHDASNGQFTFRGGGSGGSASTRDMAERPSAPKLPSGAIRTASGRVIVNRPTVSDNESDTVTVRPKADQVIDVSDGRTIIDRPTATYRNPGLNGKGYRPKSEDTNLLARIIYAESLSNPEDFEAIGWATVNRVGERQHGMTLDKVIRKPGRFEPLNGSGSALWRETADPSKLKGDKLKGWARALSVSDGIIMGTIADPTKGATYFVSSPTYTRGGKNTGFPFFDKRLASGTFVDASYVSTSPRKRQNYFFAEVPVPPAPKTPKKEVKR